MTNKLLVSLTASLVLSTPSFAAEKYAATIEDGTAKVLSPRTNAEENRHADEYLTEEVIQRRLYSPKRIVSKKETTIEPPVVAEIQTPKAENVSATNKEGVILPPAISTTETKEEQKLAADLEQIKKQNEDLEKRLADLEKKEKNPAPVESPAPEVEAEKTESKPTEDKVVKTEDINEKAATAAAYAGSEDEEESDAEIDSATQKTTTLEAVTEANKPKTPAQSDRVNAVKTDKGRKISFDKVQKDQVGSIAERLKFTNVILKKYGRAYDYRTTTLKELKAIYAYLERTRRS